MGVRDQSIDWMRQEMFIGCSRFGWCGKASAQFGAGDMTETEQGACGYGGLLVLAEADACATLEFDLLRKADIEEEIGFRVVWATDAAGTADDSILFAVTYETTAFGGVLAVPAVALTVPVPDHAPDPGGVDQTLNVTSRGTIAASTLGRSSRLGAIALGVTMGLTTSAIGTSDFATQEVMFHGLLVDYMPNVCISPAEDLDTFKDQAQS